MHKEHTSFQRHVISGSCCQPHKIEFQTVFFPKSEKQVSSPKKLRDCSEMKNVFNAKNATRSGIKIKELLFQLLKMTIEFSTFKQLARIAKCSQLI